jgi:hypothetical protein
MRGDDDTRVFAARDEEDLRNWLDLIQEAIDDFKEKEAHHF